MMDETAASSIEHRFEGEGALSHDRDIWFSEDSNNLNHGQQ